MPDDSPRLVIGPVLRRVAGTRATIWVEISRPATVRVEAGSGSGTAPTFCAYGHHYALVLVDGLTPGTAAPYEVWLDDVKVWPEPDWTYPRSVIRTREAEDGDQPVRLIFGSCRESTQHASTRKLPPDALDAFARRLMADPPEVRDWPDLIVLLGDQVYADETSPRVRRWLRRRRQRNDAPADQVVTFHEYTGLYLESWSDPEIRYLLSTVPSVMIFDDHEVIDDWNTSASWRADMRAESWWPERITSGLASYWIYQHLGNLGPDEIAVDPVYAKVAATEDATAALADFAAGVDQGTSPYQWSYALDLGRTRLIVLDNRCSRVLDPAGRAMLPEAEWQWFADQAHGRYDHLVVGSSLPWLLPPGVHHLETWNERLTESPRPWVVGVAEKLRRGVDLEHWGAFRRSFRRMAELFAELGSGAERPGITVGVSAGAPASISVLSGDVHHSYVAEADLGPGVTSPVHQLTCSPLHNQVPAPMRPVLRLGWGRAMTTATRWLARSAGLPPAPVRWRRVAGPYFGNAVSTLTHDGREAEVRIEGTDSDGHLHLVAERKLTAPDRATGPVPLPRTARASRKAAAPRPAPPR
ncbi:MAG TPA: alkaline phosphatase D family protein [Micromonosporaceae bacterium]|nr:alkaline phosphatase D family protein [Micromonosporaceae bacterium]